MVMDPKIKAMISSLETNYEKLVFILIQQDLDWKSAYEHLRGKFDADIMNLSYEMSKRLLAEKESRYPFLINSKLRELLAEYSAQRLILRNIEFLFEPSLKLNVIPALKNISRHQALIVLWPGEFSDNYLVYAAPGHPEHQRGYVGDVLVLSYSNGKLVYLSGGS